jgi:hypothetical protein
MIRSPAIKEKGYHGTVIAFKRHVARLRGWVAWLDSLFWHSPHPAHNKAERRVSER